MAAPTAFRETGIVTGAVASYLDDLLSPADDPLLDEMREVARRDGVPIVHDDTGRLLDVLVRLRAPRHAIEFGTAIGYSTVHIARALQPGATLTSFEIDPARHAQATAYLSRAGVRASVLLQLGDARELVTGIESVDFAFLDAAKGEYEQYLDATLERMEPGGLVVVDNALMSGTVATGTTDGHWDQASIDGQRALNARLVHDPRLAATVLPVGDGVALAVVG